VTAGFIDGLPKAELHVHLEGTLEPDLLFVIARRNKLPVAWESVEQLRAAYEFTGLEHFLPLLFAGCRVFRTREDFYDLALAYLQKASSQQVRRVELFFGAQTFLDLGIPIADQLEGVLEAMQDARSHLGIDPALILTAQRHRTQDDALELFELVQPWSDSILGFGLGSAERGNPPAKFADYFARCRSAGYRTTIHAGEDGPVDYVREALDMCRPDRIDHGLAAAGDPALVARLRDEGIPLTMCPLSNQALRIVVDLAHHPLADLLAAGVMVTVNSDDPPYFGGYVNENYAAVQESLTLQDATLAQLARNSFTGSFADSDTVNRHLAEIDSYLLSHQL
jgi:adenosine deaminase